jgi:ParB/RepB/Spo0J family partition protein
MSVTMKRKTGAKEKSIEQLARQQKRGTSARPSVAKVGQAVATEHERLRKQMADLLATRAGELDEEDLAFARRFVSDRWQLASEKTRAVLILARPPAKVPATNGHGQPAVAGPDLTPGETSTTTPAGIARRTGVLSRENGAALAFNQDLLIAIEACHPHPDNRRSSDQDPDVAELAESIRALDQQQAILVRRPITDSRYQLPPGEYQIVFGERRWRACRLAGKGHVRAKVRTDLSDAQTLELIAVENAQRKDLNPIERARLVERLCKPVADGGAGLTLEAAAKDVGLSHASSASNLRRLLELPQVWQDRVAAGELPESFARLLLPYVPAPKLMQAIDADWKKAHGPKSHAHDREGWESRAALEDHLLALASDHTRPLGKGQTHHYNNQEIPGPKDDKWRYNGWYPTLFELTPEVQRDLATIEVTRQGQSQLLATNTKLYDKLQIPAIKAKVDADKRGKAAKAGGEASAPKRELTAAEKKARSKEQAEQLQRRVDAWRHDWLKPLVAHELQARPTLASRLVLAWALDDLCQEWRSRGAQERAEQALLDVAREHGSKSRVGVWEALGDVRHDAAVLREATNAALTALLTAEDPDPRQPAIEHERLDDLAAFCGIDLAAEWDALQGAHRAEYGAEAAGSRFGMFFELFQSGQLDALGEELGVYVAGAKGKAGKVKLLVSRDRNLSLPKCIKPLPSAKATESKRRARR